AAGGIVVRAVARAEPAAVVARVEGRHAAQVGAGADDHEILLMTGLGALGIGLSRAADGALVHDLLELGFGAVAHENRLALPLDDDLLAFLDLGDVELD